jgi:hypothetical protein
MSQPVVMMKTRRWLLAAAVLPLPSRCMSPGSGALSAANVLVKREEEQ